MKDEVLDLLQDPYTQDRLELRNGILMNPSNGRQYFCANEYYSFVNDEEIVGNNKKYSSLYDKISWIYNIGNKIYFFFKFGNEYKARSEYLRELEINDGDKVLEVSIGTGDNLPYLNQNSDFYGIDISKGMLKMAVKHLNKWKIPAYLFRCQAEKLPFQDNTFDVVFHIGGINYFNDKQNAINEMIRVAKPGTKIMIVDETEKCISEIYQKNPFSKEYYQDTDEAIVPLELIPSTMEDIAVNIVNDGLFYCITFRKPI